VLLLARSIVPRPLRRQSTRLCRVLRFAAAYPGDKRRVRDLEPPPEGQPRFKRVNHHLWGNPMLDLESLLRSLNHARMRAALVRDNHHAEYMQMVELHRHIQAIENIVQSELSRLHEKQPEA